MDEEFIDASQASVITGMSVGALAQLRYRGFGPRFYKPTPRTVRYRRSELMELMEWMEASAHAQEPLPSFA